MTNDVRARVQRAAGSEQQEMYLVSIMSALHQSRQLEAVASTLLDAGWYCHQPTSSKGRSCAENLGKRRKEGYLLHCNAGQSQVRPLPSVKPRAVIT